MHIQFSFKKVINLKQNDVKKNNIFKKKKLYIILF